METAARVEGEEDSETNKTEGEFVTPRGRSASGDVDDGDKSNSTSTIDAHSNGLSLDEGGLSALDEQDLMPLDDDGSAHSEWVSRQLSLALERGVLDVHCKGRPATLHLDRFGSGNRGKSLFVGEEERWLTPSEFEAFCGRAQCKDWKRSIKFHNRSLLQLIELGILRVHAVHCTCTSCWTGVVEGPVNAVRYHDGKRKTFKRVCGHNTRHAIFDETTKNLRIEMVPQASSALCGQFIRSPGGTVRFLPMTQATSGYSGIEKIDAEMSKTRDSSSPTRRIAPLPTSHAFFAEFAVLEKNVDAVQHQLNSFQAQLKSIRQIAERYFDSRSHTSQPSESKSTSRAAASASDVQLCTNCNHPATLTCASCQRVFYCGEFCVRRDAANHRRQCAASTAGAVHNVIID